MACVGPQWHTEKKSNINCQNLINHLAVVTSSIVDAQWEKPGVTSHFQRNVFETQHINMDILAMRFFETSVNCLPVGTACTS